MASGNSLFVLTPKSAELPSTNYPQWVSRNNIALLAFDAATIETAVFRVVIPSHYSGGGLTFDATWMGATATSGDVVIGIAIERDNANNHDLDTDAFATQQTATGTANGTSGKTTVTTVTVSSGANMDSATAGDAIRIQFQRVASSGSDTMTGDMQLLTIHCKET